MQVEHVDFIAVPVTDLARAAATSSTRSSARPFFVGSNSMPKRSGSQIAKHVSPTQNSFHACSSGGRPSVST